ncbi:MAG: hypothetical protein VXZ82_21600 [Planctomycetota bacterium]|nr:hypothetical protein [Planctomycetota bacterium]
MAFALLMMLYGIYQLLLFPRYFGMGTQIIAIALAIIAGSFAGSITLMKYARRSD